MQAFYGAGGENPESFLRAFSWEILESAFKVINFLVIKLSCNICFFF